MPNARVCMQWRQASGKHMPLPFFILFYWTAGENCLVALRWRVAHILRLHYAFGGLPHHGHCQARGRTATRSTPSPPTSRRTSGATRGRNPTRVSGPDASVLSAAPTSCAATSVVILGTAHSSAQSASRTLHAPTIWPNTSKCTVFKYNPAQLNTAQQPQLCKKYRQCVGPFSFYK